VGKKVISIKGSKGKIVVLCAFSSI